MAAHGLSARLGPPFARAAGRGLTLALLLALLLASIAGMTAALQGPDLAVLWLGLLAGALLGWGLALGGQPALRSAALVLAGGLLFLLLVPGGLGAGLAGLLAEALHRLAARLPFPTGPAVDPGLLALRAQALVRAAQALAGRTRAWVLGLASGQPLFDPLAAALAWNALVWLVSAWAGWTVEARRNALLAVAPALLLSLATLFAARRTPPGLYLMLGLTLLLLAASRQDQRWQTWQAERLAAPAHKGRQILGMALGLTLVLVLLSAAVPAISVTRLRTWIDELRRPAPAQPSDLAQSLGILPGAPPAPDAFQALRSPGLPRQHLIGAGPELSHRVVMTVRVADLAALASGGQPLPLYWRGFTYDVYSGHGWSSSATAEQDVPADQPLGAGTASGFLPVLQEVAPVEALGGTIYAAGDPVQLDLASQAAWRSAGDLFGIQVAAAGSYQVLSLVPVADDQTLRLAGERYPDWVRQRYLSLPDEVPERVKALALRLTASGLTPYDRAVAIETYLRLFPYTLDVPQPPTGRDVADYFLFDLQKGYCDYFATAMVVLSRAAGIPARLAIGYAPGTYNLNSGRFVVTEAEAHSWAELYFPGIGWVPFEATPSHPALERSAELPPATGLLPVSLPASPAGTARQGGLPSGWLAGLFALAALGGLAWLGLDELRLRRLPAPAGELYRRLCRSGRHLALIPKAGDTPYEFSAALQARVLALGERAGRKALGAQAAADAGALVDGIVTASYRPGAAHDGRLVNRWRQLEAQLARLRLLAAVRALLRRTQP